MGDSFPSATMSKVMLSCTISSKLKYMYFGNIPTFLPLSYPIYERYRHRVHSSSLQERIKNLMYSFEGPAPTLHLEQQVRQWRKALKGTSLRIRLRDLQIFIFLRTRRGGWAVGRKALLRLVTRRTYNCHVRVHLLTWKPSFCRPQQVRQVDENGTYKVASFLESYVLTLWTPSALIRILL